jgi:hypothetical protein
VYELLGPHLSAARSQAQLCAGALVRVLPCDIFNFSTDDTDMAGPFVGPRVLHFKGARKKHMRPYFENQLPLISKTA